jgi:type I restriction enzyme M protein
MRKNIIEADIVDCMVAMPGQLFYSTQIPVCLWFISRNKRNGKGQDGKPMRDRSGETLFIDARKLGVLYDRVHRELTDEEIKRIADTYHAWRGDRKKKYEDISGFCKTAKLEEIQKHGYVLTPGRYVGAEAMEEDTEPFEEKMERLTNDLESQFAASAKLEKAIRKNMKELGYGG